MSYTNFRVARTKLHWIKQSIWLNIVTGLGKAANQSALFQCSYTTLKFVYDIGSLPKTKAKKNFLLVKLYVDYIVEAAHSVFSSCYDE